MNPLSFPKLEKYINDFSWVLDQEKSHLMNDLFAEHEKKTGEQVVVVLFPHREWNELLEIGLKVFNENGIGEKNLNNGLLLIIATEERKIRIVTGKGMELKYSEMACRDIIENQLRPLLNSGKYEEMIEVWQKITNNTLSNTSIWEEEIIWYKSQELINIFETIGRWDSSPKVGIFTMILIIPLSILGLISTLMGWMGGIVLLIPVILYIIYKLIAERISKKGKSSLVYITFIIFICIVVWFAGMSYICMKNVCLNSWGNIYSWYSSSDRWNSSSSYDWNYSSDSSSSFDGWDGSSNGGGYGD